MHVDDPQKELIYGEKSSLLIQRAINQQTITLHHQVASALENLCSALESDDLPIKIISHWRSFEHQAAIWNNKWNGTKELLDREGKHITSSLLSNQEKFESICYWSAIPGTSRHHWGTDFDVFLTKPIEQGYQVQLTQNEFAEHNLCLSLEKWLFANLESFDFYRPYQTEKGGVSAEPWHISYRPIAGPLLHLLNPTDVVDKLVSNQVSGANIIADQIEFYFKQYLLNID